MDKTEVKEYEVSKVLQYLAPWKEKTNDEESIGSWETTMATRMMLKLLELWLTEDVVYVMTGTKMMLKNGAANQHYRTICKMLREDMPQLMFANHMKYMMRTYGPKKIKH